MTWFVMVYNGLPRSITTWVWNWLVRLETSGLLLNLFFWSLSMFWTQFSFPVVFQGDLWWRPRWRIYFLVYDFSSFHPNNFRNAISWKCFVKNDCVRSSLVELQSFPQSKIDDDILRSDVSSMLYACIVHDADHSSRSCQDPYDSCPWDPQAERILPVCCSNFDHQVSIPNWWWNVNWLHIRHDKCTGRSCSE